MKSKITLVGCALLCAISMSAHNKHDAATVPNDYETTVTYHSDKYTLQHRKVQSAENKKLTAIREKEIEKDSVLNAEKQQLSKINRKRAQSETVLDSIVGYESGEGYYKYIYSYTENQTTELVYTADSVGGEWSLDSKEETSYFPNGYTKQNIDYEWKNGAWKGLRKTEYSYHEKCMYAYYTYDWDNTTDSWRYKWYDKYEYDEISGKNIYSEYLTWDTIQNQWGSGFKHVHNYDENGNRILIKWWDWDVANQKWVGDCMFVYAFDANGNEILQEYYSDDFVPYSKAESVYDANGNMTKFTEYKWSGSSWTYRYKYEYTYNANNQYTSSKYFEYNNGWIATEKTTYTYNAAGYLLTAITQTNYANASVLQNAYKTVYTYDTSNYPTSHGFYNYTSSTNSWYLTQKWTYSVNSDKIIIETGYKLNDDDVWERQNKLEYRYKNSRTTYWETGLYKKDKLTYYASYKWNTDYGWKGDYHYITDFDTNGNTSLYENYEWDETAHDWQGKGDKHTYEYTKNGNSKSKTEYSYRWNTVSRTWELMTREIYENEESELYYSYYEQLDSLKTGSWVTVEKSRGEARYLDGEHELSWRGEKYDIKSAEWIPTSYGQYYYRGITSIEQVNNDLFVLYPNPAKDVVILDGLKNRAFIKISDVNGKCLQTTTCTSAWNTIHLEGLAAGYYLLEIICDNERITKKLIKH